ncbi:uncharacterized protein LOC144124071 [Amblyomma americanum]
MYSATATLLAILVAIMDLCSAPPLELTQWPPGLTEKIQEMPDHDAHVRQEGKNDVQSQQLIGSDGSYDGANASRQASALPSRPASESSSAGLNGDRGSMQAATSIDDDGAPAWFDSAVTRGVLRFLHANQVVFFIACSCLLTGMVLLYTLMTAYGGTGSSSSSRTTGSSRRLLSESYPLLSNGDRRSGGEVSPGDSDELDTADKSPRTPCEHSPNSPSAALSDVAVGPKAAAPSHPASARPVSTSRKAYSINASSIRGPVQALQEGRQSAKKPITVFPSRLLDMCNQDAPITFADILPNPERSRSRWLAHGRHSEVFLVSSLLNHTVFKVMPVLGHFSEQRVEVITAAIECYLKLSTLRHGMRYKTPNFIEVQRIACVFDTFPEWLLRNDQRRSSTESLADSLASEMAGTNQCCLTRHFIVFELCYAGMPLSKMTLRSAVQGLSLVQQAACCMAVAERALGFRHLGVDADKLLVAPTDAESLEYRFAPGTDPVSVESAGLKAHLSGCLSCALDAEGRDDDDFEYHEATFGSPTSDCTGRAAPRFYGNVMWLGAVLDSVLHKLRSEVPEPRARGERTVFEQLLSWQSRLQQCNSADDFVATAALAAQP